MSETTTIEDPRPRTASAVGELAGRRAALKDAEPELRARDAAERLGGGEAEPVASGCPSGTAVRLDAGLRQAEETPAPQPLLHILYGFLRLKQKKYETHSHT